MYIFRVIRKHLRASNTRFKKKVSQALIYLCTSTDPKAKTSPISPVTAGADQTSPTSPATVVADQTQADDSNGVTPSLVAHDALLFVSKTMLVVSYVGVFHSDV